MEHHKRCSWCNLKNETYVKYHDEEWGCPLYDDQKLYELLILGCFQAGLSWECVLNKRESFRAVFDGFDIDKVIAYDEETSPLSDAISKDLKKRGMTFVGSTIIYSFLQSMGVINGHSKDCMCYTSK